MTTTNTAHMMQCGCGMVGTGVEVENDTDTETFRDRVFHVTSKDGPMVHEVRFQWKEEDRHSTTECRGEV